MLLVTFRSYMLSFIFLFFVGSYIFGVSLLSEIFFLYFKKFLIEAFAIFRRGINCNATGALFSSLVLIFRTMDIKGHGFYP